MYTQVHVDLLFHVDLFAVSKPLDEMAAFVFLFFYFIFCFFYLSCILLQPLQGIISLLKRKFTITENL